MIKKFAKRAGSLLLAVMLLVSSMCLEAFAAETPDAVMEVTVGETTTSYTDFGKGWVAAVKASTSTLTTIKLLANWTPDSTINDGVHSVPAFKYVDENGDEYGTEDGQLHLDNENIHLTIDLNGYTIDRGLREDPTRDGRVFYIQNGNLTIMDSSDAKSGTITGGRTINSTWSGDAARGGAIFIENDSVLRIEGGNICGNKSFDSSEAQNRATGGAIYAMDNATVYMSGGTITNNEVEYEGAGLCFHEYASFYMSGGLISNNIAQKRGGGIYILSDGVFCLTGGEISGNIAKAIGSDPSFNGGGVYIPLRSCSPEIFFGGGIKICNNTSKEGTAAQPDNFCIYDGFTDGCEFKHAVTEQKGEFPNVPHAPLNKDAMICINFIPYNWNRIEEDILNLSDEDSHFYEDSYKYFHSDCPEQVVRGVYNTKNPSDPYHEIHYVSTAIPEGKIPAIESVYTLRNSPLVSASLDNTNNTIELIAKANMRNYFEKVSLDQLIGANFNASNVSILDANTFINNYEMLDGLTYKVINSLGTYSLYTVTVTPEGVDWSDTQEDITTSIGNHKLIVRNDSTDEARGYASFKDGWEAAYNMAKNEGLNYPSVTVTLRANWEATDGDFDYESGTNNGRLYVDGSDTKITIDLNGYTIDRNIGEKAVSHGQVFRIASGATLTIQDNSAAQTGTITGGNNDGKGGAFYIDYGTLYIGGGSISGNKAVNGGGIYVENENDSYVYIRGGSIAGNTASEYGGGIHCWNGYLFLEGGTISGNSAKRGGGIYWVSDDPTVWTGTTVTGNSASEYGGGIYAENNDDIYVGGSIRITGNTVNGQANNLYISEGGINIYKTDGQKISGEADIIPNLDFARDAMIGLSVYDSSNNYTFTTDDSKFDADDYRFFSADSSDYVIRSEPNNDNTYKLHLTKKSNTSYGNYTIKFNAGAGTGSMSDITLPANSSYALPECGFTAPNGADFVGWGKADGRIYQPGEIFTATENLTYTAKWMFNAPTGVSFTATDDSSGVLSGVDSSMEYRVVGVNPSNPAAWMSIDGDSVELNQMLNGNSEIHVRYKAYTDASGNSIIASDPVIIKVDQAKYTGADVVDAKCGLNNGSLVARSTDMEYSANGSTWTSIIGDHVNDLAPGEYFIRVKASGSVLASRPASVTVNQLGHSFTTDWSSDKNHHWHAATCGHDAVADKAEHFYDGGTCECGAEEEDPVYRVTVAPNNESYGTVTGSGSYTAGSSVTVTATAKEGYRFVRWLVGYDQVSNSSSYTFTVNANTDLTAVFEVIPTYSINVVKGTANVSGAVEGTTVTITAEAADAGYRFVGWTSEDVTLADATAVTTTFVMPGKAVTVTATYEEIPATTYTVSVSASPTEGGTVDGAGTYEEGKEVTVTATANEGYEFVKWTAGDAVVSTDASYTFNVTESVELVAEFKAKTPTPEKTATPKITYNEGTFTVEATGVGTVILYVDDVVVSNPYTFKQGDEDVAYEVTATAQEEGKPLSDVATKTVIVPAKADEPTTHSITVVGGIADVTEAKAGDTVTITADDAPAGMQFKEWTSEDGVVFANASADVTTFVMPDKKVTVTANYEAVSVLETFTVVYTDGVYRAEVFEDLVFEDLPYGSETPEFNGIPRREGYRFNGWSPAVAAIVTGDATYTATWIKNNSGVDSDGSYVPVKPEISVADTENGDVTVSPEFASEGSTVTIVVTPDAGYTLETLTVTDKEGNEIELTYEGDGKYTFEMPASKVTIEVTFMDDNTMLNFFVDVSPSAYYYNAVLWAVKQGITNGTDAIHFSPDLSCTRSQSVTFLWRAAGSPKPVSTYMPFTDVQEGSYYYDAVLWAVENGITNGTSATTFGPDSECTRAQIVTFLMRALMSSSGDIDNPFCDVDTTAYYMDAVLWAVENGITNGTSDTTFNPNSPCTRAQIVTFLYRALNGK